MGDYDRSLLEEKQYLEETICAAKKELMQERNNMAERKRELVQAGKEMWEESVHFSNDFAKMTEVSQHLSNISSQTGVYRVTAGRARVLGKMLDNPYFGRVDMADEGSDENDKVYIGIGSLIEKSTGKIYVYDWRAPVSSIFYRFEPGKASYISPMGKITVEVLLKRQYKIEKSQLKYFFDCSMRIVDEMLQEVLGHNASEKMRNIVETIQKEQDFIIRDRENDLLIVQGVAGSGKSSIALHRVAFLLYEGMGSGLGSNNIIIISPNAAFSKYISGVLPELGEENVREITVEELLSESFDKGTDIQTRNMQLEDLITGDGSLLSRCMEFKGSVAFIAILDKLISYYEHKVIEFEDVYFDGVVLETRQELKNSFLNNKLSIPAAKRLQRLEERIMNSVNPLQRKRISRIEELVQKGEGPDFEIKLTSRVLSMKEIRAFTNRIHKFTRISCFEMYRKLFDDRALFKDLARSVQQPDDIDEIINFTRDGLGGGQLRYEDAVALLYLKLRVDGSRGYADIKQVVIDEAQDYYPMHYKVISLLFPTAKFTVTGDICQSVERPGALSIYESVIKVLARKHSARIIMNRSYRSSYEISTFAISLLGAEQDFIPFERHETPVQVITGRSRDFIEGVILAEIKTIRELGYGSAAVICKTRKEAAALHLRLKEKLDIRLALEDEGEIGGGIVILSAYEAKGLEFDAVLVPDVSVDNYKSELDRRLLYIACTRPLHRLSLYSAGPLSGFVPFTTFTQT